MKCQELFLSFFLQTRHFGKIEFSHAYLGKDKHVFEDYLNKYKTVFLAQYDKWFLTENVISEFCKLT